MSDSVFAHAAYGWAVKLSRKEVSELKSITKEFDDPRFGSYDFEEAIENSKSPQHQPLTECLQRIVRRLIKKIAAKPLLEHVPYFQLHFVTDPCRGSDTENGTVILGFGLLAFPHVTFPSESSVAPLEVADALKDMHEKKAEWYTWVT